MSSKVDRLQVVLMASLGEDYVFFLPDSDLCTAKKEYTFFSFFP